MGSMALTYVFRALQVLHRGYVRRYSWWSSTTTVPRVPGRCLVRGSTMATRGSQDVPTRGYLDGLSSWLVCRGAMR